MESMEQKLLFPDTIVCQPEYRDQAKAHGRRIGLNPRDVVSVSTLATMPPGVVEWFGPRLYNEAYMKFMAMAGSGRVQFLQSEVA